jgi:hypothetical protein
MDLNYYEILIAVADDCPVTHAVAPSEHGGRPSVATLQYELIAGDPYEHTQEDVLFESWIRWQPSSRTKTKPELARLREEFFAKPQPCLRASPLPKKYGWGLLFNKNGRVALCAMESAEYRRIVGGKAVGVKVLKALRSSRG